MEHIVAYEGKVLGSLGLMQDEYIKQFVPWANKRIGIEGTLLRPPYTLESGIEWLRKTEKDSHFEVFAVLRKKQGGYDYVGHTALHGIQWPHGFASTGSVIGANDARGIGLGTEAKLLLLYHAFIVVSIRKVVSTVKAFNAQSAGHLVKCGYKYVGRYRQHHFHEGQFIDELIFEVFREDWEPIWSKYQETSTLPKLTDAQRTFIQDNCR